MAVTIGGEEEEECVKELGGWQNITAQVPRTWMIRTANQSKGPVEEEHDAKVQNPANKRQRPRVVLKARAGTKKARVGERSRRVDRTRQRS